MDPDEALREIVWLLQLGRYREAIDKTEALLCWQRRGGFGTSVVFEEVLR